MLVLENSESASVIEVRGTGGDRQQNTGLSAKRQWLAGVIPFRVPISIGIGAGIPMEC